MSQLCATPNRFLWDNTLFESKLQMDTIQTEAWKIINGRHSNWSLKYYNGSPRRYLPIIPQCPVTKQNIPSSRVCRPPVHNHPAPEVVHPTINVEHHLPERGPHGLVEAEPHLAAAAQGVVVAPGLREERAAHGRVPAGGGAAARGGQAHTQTPTHYHGTPQLLSGPADQQHTSTGISLRFIRFYRLLRFLLDQTHR
jgi:hypothetical protein